MKELFFAPRFSNMAAQIPMWPPNAIIRSHMPTCTCQTHCFRLK